MSRLLRLGCGLHRRRLARAWRLLSLVAATVAVLSAGSAIAGSEAGATATPCLPIGGQGLLVMLMLILSCCVHAQVTVLQVELSRADRLDRWCASSSARRFLLIVGTALLTGLALLVEILMWAGLYHALGLFSSVEARIYFSGITFTTVGYGDMTLPGCLRLLSVGEALNGVLMAGWSTAQLITVVQRMMHLRLNGEGLHRH